MRNRICLLSFFETTRIDLKTYSRFQLQSWWSLPIPRWIGWLKWTKWKSRVLVEVCEAFEVKRVSQLVERKKRLKSLGIKDLKESLILLIWFDSKLSFVVIYEIKIWIVISSVRWICLVLLEKLFWYLSTKANLLTLNSKTRNRMSKCFFWFRPRGIRRCDRRKSNKKSLR